MMSESSNGATERYERLGERPPQRTQRGKGEPATETKRPKWFKDLPLWVQDSESLASESGTGYYIKWWFFARFFTNWMKLKLPIYCHCPPPRG